MTRSSVARPVVTRAPRSDGVDTRRLILETAGPIYAEKGFARTTSKEICASAGTNAAAVNYHFGSKAGLYEAVLIEAHGQLIGLDELQAIQRGGGEPIERLHRLLRTVLERIVGGAPPWGLAVVVHELLNPSEHLPVMVRQAILPKARVVFGLFGEVLGVPPDHPAVQRAVVCVLLPCMVLLVVPKAIREMVVPAIDRDPATGVDELLAYTTAGLMALKQRHSS